MYSNSLWFLLLTRTDNVFLLVWEKSRNKLVQLHIHVKNKVRETGNWRKKAFSSVKVNKFRQTKLSCVNTIFRKDFRWRRLVDVQFCISADLMEQRSSTVVTYCHRTAASQKAGRRRNTNITDNRQRKEAPAALREIGLRGDKWAASLRPVKCRERWITLLRLCEVSV